MSVGLRPSVKWKKRKASHGLSFFFLLDKTDKLIYIRRYMKKQKEHMPIARCASYNFFCIRSLALMICNASGSKRRVQKCYAVILVGLVKSFSQSIFK